jgi:hypothetical protein
MQISSLRCALFWYAGAVDEYSVFMQRVGMCEVNPEIREGNLLNYGKRYKFLHPQQWQSLIRQQKKPLIKI